MRMTCCSRPTSCLGRNRPSLTPAGAVPEIDGDEFPTLGAIGFQRWQQYEHPLRADERLLAFFPFRRVSDESALVNSHHESPIAAGRIEGARRTTGRWPGKATLLFDRDSDFVRLHIPEEHQERSIAVWLRVDRFDFGLNAILNADGHESGRLSLPTNASGIAAWYTPPGPVPRQGHGRGCSQSANGRMLLRSCPRERYRSKST